MRGRSRFSTAIAAIAVVLSVLAAERAARAQAAPTPAASKSDAGPLKVWVDAHKTELDKGRLRDFLSRELKREVVLSSDAGGAALLIRLQHGSRAQVEYTTPSGERLTRDVELPPDKDRSLEVLSWLSVNLVRDEASELLDELRARRKEEADARASEEQAAA